jgi:hypothetical protein
VAVLRAYTGPWYVAINFYLRYLPNATCCTSTPYYVDDTHSAYKARRFFLSDPARPDWCKLCGRARAEHHRQPVDSWATSAALLYSGIVKLASVSHSATVYRGVSEVHVRLPDSFVSERDAQGFMGGVELGVMSTTTEETVALAYMKDEGKVVPAALFAVTFAKQTRGADVAFLSQYPAEREMLYPPGTSLTCQGVTRLGVGQRKLALIAEYEKDNKLRELVGLIDSLDYQPHDALRTVLNPLSFDTELREYEARFVTGTRDWVFDTIDAWLADTGSASRCRVLLGGPGFGKTAIVAHLCTTRRHAVLGVHLCKHNDKRKRDPRRMVTTLAHQLAQALPDYRAALEAKAQQLTREVDSLTTTELVDTLLVQPLGAVPPPRGSARKLLVIDALDEAEHEQKNELLRLIKNEFPKLPAWLKVLLTARPELPIKRELSVLQPQELDAEHFAKQCDEDVRLFLHSVLTPVVPAAELAVAVAATATKANRNFLYLLWLRKRIEAGTFTLDALPDGLGGHYQEQLERLGLPKQLEGDVGRVLCTILAAAKPLHIKHELPMLSGVLKCHELVVKLSQLFPVRDDHVHIFHKSIADWLTASPPYDDRHDESDFYVDRAEGHRMLAAACAAKPSNGYQLRWAVHHCAEAREWDAFARLAGDLAHLDARFAAGSGAALGLDLGLVHSAPCAAAVAPSSGLCSRRCLCCCARASVPSTSSHPSSLTQALCSSRGRRRSRRSAATCCGNTSRRPLTHSCSRSSAVAQSEALRVLRASATSWPPAGASRCATRATASCSRRCARAMCSAWRRPRARFAPGSPTA